MSHNIFSKYHDLIRSFNTNQLVETLEYNGLGDCCDIIRAKNIDGNTFLDLTHAQLTLWRNILNAVQITRLWSVVQLAQSKPTAFLISVNEPQPRTTPTNQPSPIGSTKSVGKYPIANKLKSLLEQKQFGGFPPPPASALENESQEPENPQFHPPNNSYLHTAQHNSYHNSQNYNSPNQNQGYNEYTNQEFGNVPAYVNESFSNPDQNRGYNVPSASNNLGYNPSFANQSYHDRPTTKNLKQQDNYNQGYNLPSSVPNRQSNQRNNAPSQQSIQSYNFPPSANNSQRVHGYNFPAVNKNNQGYNIPPSIKNAPQTQGYNPRSNQRYNPPPSVIKSQPIVNNPHLRTNQGYNPPSAPPIDNNQRPTPFSNRHLPPPPPTELIPPTNTNQGINNINSRSNFFQPPSNFFPHPPPLIPSSELPRPPIVPIFHDSDGGFDSGDEAITEVRPNDSYDYRAQEWYRNISRKEAEALLAGQIDGTFAVRPSRRIEHECTISIMCNDKIYHLGIIKHQGKLLLGNNYFDSMNEIVARFLQEPIVLNGANNQELPVILKL